MGVAYLIYFLSFLRHLIVLLLMDNRFPFSDNKIVIKRFLKIIKVSNLFCGCKIFYDQFEWTLINTINLLL